MYFLFLALFAFAVIYTLKVKKKPRDFPPGPAWLPIVGCSSELVKLSRALGGQYKALSALSAQYKTNVLGLKLGRDLVVVVFSYPTVRTVCKSEEYDGRPDNLFIKLRCLGTRKGITCTDGEHWSIQRNFLIRHLRLLGFGQQTMDSLIRDELSELHTLIEQNGPELKIGEMITPSVINVLWALTAGKRIPRDDPLLVRLLDLLRKRTRIFDMSGGVLSQHPWLRYVAPDWSGYNLMLNLNRGLRDFFMETIKAHYKTWKENKDDDIIYAFISRMKTEDPDNTTFTDDQLIMVCLDIFVAGSQTTSATLDFAFLMMLLRPDVQKKLQEHIDDVLPEWKILDYTDRLKLPYVEAVLLEVQRYCNVVPITGPRRVLADTVLEGYVIPKNTTVLISNYSVHMDKEFWGDPEVFRPERFLDENGQVVATDRYLVFGLGKRRCLGESLARNFIFVFFADILRKFSIEPVPGTSPPTGKSQAGITLAPEKYSANFVKRRKYNSC